MLLTLVVVAGIGITVFVRVNRVDTKALSYSGSSSYKAGKYYSRLANVSLTGNQRTDIVNVAKSQVGYQEGSSSSQLAGTSYGGKNYTEYGRWYGLQDMWCAMFVSWCADTAGVSTSIVPKHCYTPTGLQWFKDRGLAYSRASVAKGNYTPKAGDIIYFKSSRNNNSTNHVGIVTKYSNGTVYTIEGNTSSATISTNGGAVCEKSYSISNTYIVYICSPKYKNTSTGSSNTSTTTSTSSSSSWLTGAAKDIVFDAEYYANKYSDLKAAFGTDASKLFNHFLSYGIKEGRCASPVFDVKYYVENNSDLKSAFGTDYVAAVKHFVNNGINEARVTAKPVNLGDKFKAKINYKSAGLNFSLSDDNVIVYTPSDAAAQTWTFERHSSGAYRIVNSKNGKSLATKAYTSESNVYIADYKDSRTQLWYIYEKSNGNYVFRSMGSSGCVIDVYGAAKDPLTNVWLYNYNGSTAQTFGISKQGEAAKPVDLGSEFYAKITASSGKNLSLSDNNVIIYGASKAAAQVWRFARNNDGSYRIINQKTGYCLDVYGASSASGTNVQIYAGNDSTAQKWFIYKNGDKYSLKPACADKCSLDVTGNGSADMTNVQIYTSNDSDAQKFSINMVDDYLSAVAPVDLGTNFYARIKSELGKNLSLSDNNVILYTPSEKPAQVWKFVRQSDGSYELVNTKNNKLLTVEGNVGNSGTNVVISADGDGKGQRWFIYLKEGKYMFRPATTSRNVLNVEGAKGVDLANIQILRYADSAAQRYSLEMTDAVSTSSTSSNNMEVLRKIMYAVETGGQVYGKCDYTDFTEAYTNTPEEHAITIGAGQWFGPEAKTLLNKIRSTDPALFAKLDTAGIASDLDNKNWSTYKLSKTSAKAKCIQKIIGSDVGIKCQDQLMDEQLRKYMEEAASLGVTDEAAKMMCANIRHLGGLGAVKRILNKTTKPYTLDSIYKAMQTDTGNQVGTFKSRNLMVYNSIKKYVK